MQGIRSWLVVGLVGAFAAGGCSRDEDDGDGTKAQGPQVPPAAVAQSVSKPPPAPATAADSAEARARIAARADSVRTAFQRARPLTAREVAELRQDVNAEQIATARSLGMRVSGDAEIEKLLREGKLVALGDSTAYWVLRDMDHSVPYVTPDTRAMLVHLGRRFHARLDSIGVPRYRMKVTSALRTDATQAELRKINSYASRIVSAHEFGTTVDVSHERFAIPAISSPGTGAGQTVAFNVREMEEMLEEAGREHAKVLQAELGRAIGEMRNEGALRVMMENRQPVYHMTTARRFAAADGRQ